MGASFAMGGFSISQHAAERYVERVDPKASLQEARAAIRGYAHGINAACDIGCKSVRLACGARLIINPDDRQVVTVYAAKPKVHSIQRSGHALSFCAVRRKAKYGERLYNGVD